MDKSLHVFATEKAGRDHLAECGWVDFGEFFIHPRMQGARRALQIIGGKCHLIGWELPVRTYSQSTFSTRDLFDYLEGEQAKALKRLSVQVQDAHNKKVKQTDHVGCAIERATLAQIQDVVSWLQK